MKKILLAYQSGQSSRNDSYINLLPTGLCYLHSCLKEAGHDSILANFSTWSKSRITQELLNQKPDLIGISQWTHNRHTSMELAQLCRNILPDSIIIMGGGHATFCYDDVLKENSPVDIVVIGEGEQTLLELVDLKARSELRSIAGVALRNNGKILVTPPRQQISDLDSLPLASQYLESSVGLDIEMQAEFIVTTRGCPSTCYFCSSPDFWGQKVRFRSPAAIVAEIQYISETYGSIYFSIRDDTFTADRLRVIEFCRLLQTNNVNILWNCQSRVTAIDEELVIEMKRSGCECIQLGVESGSSNILRQLGKKITTEQIESACSVISKTGVNLSIYLISDVPGETAEDISQTIKLVRNIKPDDGYVSPLAYYPGTQLYKRALSNGDVSPEIFQASTSPALYVSSPSRNSSQRLLRELMHNYQNDPERFKKQKADLGYCYITNIIASEWHNQRGEVDKAEKELLEIVAVQPDNPWGWFLLGDLYSRIGKAKKGRECYAKVLAIIPQHLPSKKSYLQT